MATLKFYKNHELSLTAKTRDAWSIGKQLPGYRITETDEGPMIFATDDFGLVEYAIANGVIRVSSQTFISDAINVVEKRFKGLGYNIEIVN